MSITHEQKPPWRVPLRRNLLNSSPNPILGADGAAPSIVRFMAAMRVHSLEIVPNHEPTIPSSLSCRSEAQVAEGGPAHAEPGEGSPPGS